MGIFKKDRVVIIADEVTKSVVKEFANMVDVSTGEVDVIPAGELTVIGFNTRSSKKTTKLIEKTFEMYHYHVNVMEHMIWITKEEL